MKNENVRVVLAAGGNPTGIIFVENADGREEYAPFAKEYMGSHPDVEQFGFIEETSHFQMSGGEFCGNAARAAALLISQKTGKTAGSFTMSGFDGTVDYLVLHPDVVTCTFTGLPISSKPVMVEGKEATLVDLGGIVHVVLPESEKFRDDKEYYTTYHRKVTSELNLGSRAAVGVVWQSLGEDGSVSIDPVVWVRDIDSFFYETACGSGTLAVLVASQKTNVDIVQPTGQAIHSEKLSDTSYLLRSTMGIT